MKRRLGRLSRSSRQNHLSRAKSRRNRTILRLAGFQPLEDRRLLACVAGGPDANDQTCEAGFRDVGTTTGTFNIDPNDDVDMFQVSLAAGQFVGFDVDNTSGSSLDSYLRLFDDTGAQVAFSDDDPGPLPENSIRESYLEFIAPSSGDYFVGISSFQNQNYNAEDGTGDSAGSSIGGFTLEVLDLDANDQISEAASIAIGSTSGTFNIDSTRDVDLFEINATAGDFLGFDIDNLTGSALDAEIRLFEASGTEIAVDDDTNGPAPEESGLESYLEFDFTISGSYYLGVTHFSNDSYDINTGLGDDGSQTATNIGEFTLTVSQVSPEVPSLVVTTIADAVDIFDQETSLREAITFANSAGSPGADTITFDASLTGQTVNVTSGELPIVTESLTIDGLGQNNLTISGNHTARLFHLDLNAGDHFTIEDITLRDGGTSSLPGGAIYSNDSAYIAISVLGSTLTSNEASSGGAIFASSRVTIEFSTISDNTAASYGGGISINDAPHDVPLTITSSTISGNSADIGGGINAANNGFTVELEFSNVTGNTATSKGGGIYANDVDLRITSYSNVNNNTVTAGHGGGLYLGGAGGIATIDDSDIEDNTVTGSMASGELGHGGGIFNYGFELDIIDSYVNYNNATTGGGGGVYSKSTSQLTITGSEIDLNDSSDDGGGLFITGTPTTIEDSTISGNGASIGSGGGISAQGGANVTIDRSTIDGNTATFEGGGVESDLSRVTITDSTISGNSGRNGGGVYSVASPTTNITTLVNSTVSGNTASRNGGGIYNRFGLTVLRHSTVTDNEAAAFYTLDDGGGYVTAYGGSGVASRSRNGTRTEVTDTIISGNVHEDVAIVSPSSNSFINTFDSVGHNLIGSGAPIPLGAGHTLDAFNQSGDMTTTAPQLGLLSSNGGPTQTHEPLATSLAINAGDPTATAGVGNTPQFDQRGSGFGRVVGGRIDIGAMESDFVPPSLGCDFDGDGVCDGDDIDTLQANIVTGPADPGTFDLTGDGQVTVADRDQWLALAGAENLASGNAYLLGDANLDGTVDGQDFLVWNANKFSSSSAWTDGDFNSDGTVDGQDFLSWNANKFQSADNVPSVARDRRSRWNRDLNDGVENDRDDSTRNQQMIDQVFAVLL